ncbi:MAG: M13 family metallopeptidase [Daejeonella sp.]|uniref:M13 family metallopeptidase n=1 Tax=Daejeonella sp. TaxID=2805397 RepID=UPI002736CCC5|nr:M13 family metallopeptidase [Daejeonella sp.]MDP3470131.1 M13 family metallopeptidase [Daejeonella sp.]
MNKNYIKLMLFGAIFTLSLQVSAQHDSKPVKKLSFIDKESMDLSKKPGDDFYNYASGTWIKNNPVPAKETRWGSFNLLRDFNISAVKTILAESADNKSAAPGSIEKRVGDFYAAGMDSVTIEKLGYSPILTDLEKVAQLSDLNGLINHAAEMRTSGAGSPFFGFFVGQDRKYVKNIVPQLFQGGTTLPDRDYYLKDDPRSLQIQESYKKYVSKLFTLTGSSHAEAEKNADIIFSMEKTLAAAQMSRLEMRDPYKTYNKFAIAELSKTTPNLNWETLLPLMKVTGQDTVLVNSPKFFTELNSLLGSTPLDDLKTYMKWNVLKSSAPYLSSDFVDASFAFTQTLTGQKVQTPRWQRMSSLSDGSVGDLLGQIYVKKHFKPEAKARMQELVNNLVKAYEIRIKNLDWMTDVTKQKALDKLYAFTPKIAYPDKWKNYEGLEINRETFFDNVRNAGSWSYSEMLKQLDKPVDKTRWAMTAPTVNAYYNPVNNEIVFPAGILQFPFFDANADDAVNYGGIGAVIGHEISHGFDDSGSQYDKDGTLRNWWTDEDRSRFKVKATALQEQFDAYTVLDTIHVNGKLTLGENIGDLGGLNAAYEAFKMTKQGQSNVKIDGFTPDQRFFLSWAQVWKGNILNETAAQLIVTDTHSPGPYRTIGAPVNMDAWYKAFDVKPGDKLYKKPEDRIRIW